MEAEEEISIGAHRMSRQRKYTTDSELQPRVYLSSDCNACVNLGAAPVRLKIISMIDSKYT